MLDKLSIILFIGIFKLSIPVQAMPPASGTTFESYRQECLQRTRREGLANDVANALCNCTIQKFQARYTLTQFRALVQKSKTDKTAARTLTTVGEVCFDEILYEN